MKSKYLYAGLLSLISLFIFKGVFVFFPEFSYDSDQAIIGLMAKHISEGNSFPLFFYGQKYLLGLEAYLGAFLFLFTDPSVMGMKYLMFIVNLGTVLFFFHILQKQLSLRDSLLITLFFSAPPFFFNVKLMEFCGGNSLLLLFTLLIYHYRKNLKWFCFISGLAMSYRSFSLFPIVSIILIDVLYRLKWNADFFKSIAKEWAKKILFIYIVSYLPVIIAKISGQYWGPKPPKGIIWRDVPRNLNLLIQENLPTLYNLKDVSLFKFDLKLKETLSQNPFSIILPILFLLLIGRILYLLIKKNEYKDILRKISPFSLFLSFIAVLNIVAFVVKGRYLDHMSIRYLIFTWLFFPGLYLIYIKLESQKFILNISHVLVLTICLANAWTYIPVYQKLSANTEPTEAQQIIKAMQVSNIKACKAPYWTSYHLSFLTNEKIIFASTQQVRVKKYHDIAEEQEPNCIIQKQECAQKIAPILKVGSWYICRNG